MSAIFTLALVLVLLGPPLVLGLLVSRFWKLRLVRGLTGHARTRRLVVLALLAAGSLGTLYGLVRVVSAELPGGPHETGSSSSFPWLHRHPALVVALTGLAAAVALLRRPDLRPAGFSFVVGALPVLGALGVNWYQTDYQQDLLEQLYEDDVTYRDAGWQQATLDSFRRVAPRYRSTSESDVTAPTYAGGDPELQAQLRALLNSSPRPPLDAYVVVECLVDTAGRTSLPHVVWGLGAGYDEAAVRAVRHLPPLQPAIGREVVPIAVVWKLNVLFAGSHRAAPEQKLYPKL